MGNSVRLSGLVVAGALLLVLSGCTSGDRPNTSTATVADSPPSTSAAPTSASPKPTPRPYPADVPLTGHNVKPGEKPPLYPAAARARTQEGANAFAEFYMRTFDWAYATTNPSYVRHYTGPTCGLCTGLATGINKTASAEHWYLGGRFTVHEAVGTPKSGVTAPADYCTKISISTAAGSVVDKTGKVFNGDGAHTDVGFKLCMRYANSDWLTTYLARL
jgi:Family of unknown function (DUF6318)